MTTLFTISKFKKACSQIDSTITEGVSIYFASSNGFDFSKPFKTKQEAKVILALCIDKPYLELNIWPCI